MTFSTCNLASKVASKKTKNLVLVPREALLSLEAAAARAFRTMDNREKATEATGRKERSIEPPVELLIIHLNRI